MRQLLQRLKARVKEHGFSMPEMLIVIVIIGILAGIAFPVYSAYQRSQNEQVVKDNLTYAASLIEQEKLDNNGLYPSYLPNELLENSKWKAYPYTFSDDRRNFCIEGLVPGTTNDKWYVSNTDKTPSHRVCTYPNIAKNSALPWGGVTVTTPTLTNYSNRWGTLPTAAASGAWTASQCNIENEGWTYSSIQYQMRVVDITRNTYVDSVASTNLSITDLNLAGFYPEDQIQYRVRAICNISWGTGYQYRSAWSDPLPNPADTVALFTINPPSINSATYTWDVNDSAPKASASWATATCTLGDVSYNYTFTQNGTTISGNTTSTSIYGIVLTGFTYDQKSVLTVKTKCSLNNGKSYVSTTGTTNTQYVPPRTPSAPSITVSTTGDPDTTMNSIAASTSTCQSGTTPVYTITVDNVGTVTSNSTSGVGSFSGSAPNVTYTARATVYCRGVNINSASSDSASRTFTTGYGTLKRPSDIWITNINTYGSTTLSGGYGDGISSITTSSPSTGCARWSSQDNIVWWQREDGNWTSGNYGNIYNGYSTWFSTTNTAMDRVGSRLGFTAEVRCYRSADGATTWSGRSGEYAITVGTPIPSASGSISTSYSEGNGYTGFADSGMYKNNQLLFEKGSYACDRGAVPVYQITHQDIGNKSSYLKDTAGNTTQTAQTGSFTSGTVYSQWNDTAKSNWYAGWANVACGGYQYKGPFTGVSNNYTNFRTGTSPFTQVAYFFNGTGANYRWGTGWASPSTGLLQDTNKYNRRYGDGSQAASGYDTKWWCHWTGRNGTGSYCDGN